MTQTKTPLLVNGREIDYASVPVSYMTDGLRLYFERGILPGSFMTAILKGDLLGAAGRADDTNRRYLYEWAAWLHNHAPAGSFGSPERVSQWVAKASQR